MGRVRIDGQELVVVLPVRDKFIYVDAEGKPKISKADMPPTTGVKK